MGDGSKISMTGSINATSSTGDLVGGLEGNAVVQFGTDAEAFVGTVSAKIEDGFNSVEVLGNSDVLFENSFNTNRLNNGTKNYGFIHYVCNFLSCIINNHCTF